ncbi:MAG: accessory Sec system protein Asp5, partial [Streptococcus salivarius]
MILLIILSVSLIITVTLQPRQIQIFSSDATSNIGRTSYWASQTLLKGLT